MRSNLSVFVSFRIVLAVVFGFMSLEHEPLMSFAQARAAQDQGQIAASDRNLASNHGHGHHGVGAGAQERGTPLPSGSSTICYSTGCFVTIVAPAICAPAASIIQIEKLIPGCERDLVQTLLEPAIQPPRLQV